MEVEDTQLSPIQLHDLQQIDYLSDFSTQYTEKDLGLCSSSPPPIIETKPSCNITPCYRYYETQLMFLIAGEKLVQQAVSAKAEFASAGALKASLLVEDDVTEHTQTAKEKKRKLVTPSQKSGLKRAKMVSLSTALTTADSDSKIEVDAPGEIADRSRLLNSIYSMGGTKPAEDVIDEQIAKDITMNIQNHHILKASKSEKASQTNWQSLNYRTRIYPSDSCVNVKIHALRKILANHLMVK